MLTGLGNLCLHATPLLRRELAGVLGHTRSGFQLAHGIGRSPAVAILDPAAFVARQPRSIGAPREKIVERIAMHDGFPEKSLANASG